MCARGCYRLSIIDYTSISTIFQLNFWIVLTVWNFVLDWYQIVSRNPHLSCVIHSIILSIDGQIILTCCSCFTRNFMPTHVWLSWTQHTPALSEIKRRGIGRVQLLGVDRKVEGSSQSVLTSVCVCVVGRGWGNYQTRNPLSYIFIWDFSTYSFLFSFWFHVLNSAFSIF